MNTFMAIMSQLFWGVTVGALSTAASTIAKAAITLGGIGGGGWWLLRRRRDARAKKKSRDED